MNLRKVVNQERQFHIAEAFRKITRAIRAGKINLVAIGNETFATVIERELEAFKDSIGDSWPEAWIRAVRKELGDPLVLQKQNIKHYTIPYWNPTPNPVNIYSLGIVKQDSAEVYQFVDPGEMVLIPWGYCQGGKLSAVKSVAPQLQPLPVPEHGLLHDYDLMPVSYLEWNTFFEFTVSNCCQKQILWNEYKTQCICQKCGSKINA
jgi:hypothetical protein